MGPPAVLSVAAAAAAAAVVSMTPVTAVLAGPVDDNYLGRLRGPTGAQHLVIVDNSFNRN